VLRSSVRNHLRLGKWNHRQQEFALGIVPKDLQRQRTEGDAQQPANASPWVHLPTGFAIHTDSKKLGLERCPAVLPARERLLQEGHRRTAERCRTKAIIWGYRGVSVNGWNTLLALRLLIFVQRVIPWHVIPPRETMVQCMKLERDTACGRFTGALERRHQG
jgi:hypothetical protein